MDIMDGQIGGDHYVLGFATSGDFSGFKFCADEAKNRGPSCVYA